MWRLIESVKRTEQTEMLNDLELEAIERASREVGIARRTGRHEEQTRQRDGESGQIVPLQLFG